MHGCEVGGKRLGVIGLGRTGAGVGLAAAGLGMQVHGWSRSLTVNRAAELGIEFHSDVDSLFATCTHITVHCAHTPETHHLVDARRLGLMPGVAADGTECGNHLLNLARGGIVDEAAACAALADGTLATCVLDVLEIEPVDPGHPIL